MPARLTRPTVGRRPTMPCWADGLTIEPEVSVPIVTAARPAAAAEPEPELEPLVPKSRSYGIEDLAAERAVAVGHAVGHEVRELGQVRLADDHRAGRAQLGHDGRIAIGNRVLECDVARRGRQPGDVEVVLDQDGDAVHRPADAAGRALEVEQRGVGQRARIRGPHRVQPRPAGVDRRDSVDVRARELHARELPCGHLRLQLGHGRALQVRHGGGRRRRPREQQARHQTGQTSNPHLELPPLWTRRLNSAARALSTARACRCLSARWG